MGNPRYRRGRTVQLPAINLNTKDGPKHGGPTPPSATRNGDMPHTARVATQYGHLYRTPKEFTDPPESEEFSDQQGERFDGQEKDGDITHWPGTRRGTKPELLQHLELHIRNELALMHHSHGQDRDTLAMHRSDILRYCLSTLSQHFKLYRGVFDNLLSFHDGLTALFDTHRDEVNRLHDELNSTRLEADAKAKELAGEITALRNDIESLQTAATRLNEVETERKVLRSLTEDLQRRLTREKNRAESTQNQLDRLSRQHVGLTMKEDRVRGKLEVAEKELSSTLHSLDRVTQAAKDAEMKLELLEVDKFRVEKQRDRAEEREQAMHEQMVQMKEDIKLLRTEKRLWLASTQGGSKLAAAGMDASGFQRLLHQRGSQSNTAPLTPRPDWGPIEEEVPSLALAEHNSADRVNHLAAALRTAKERATRFETEATEHQERVAVLEDVLRGEGTAIPTITSGNASPVAIDVGDPQVTKPRERLDSGGIVVSSPSTPVPTGGEALKSPNKARPPPLLELGQPPRGLNSNASSRRPSREASAASTSEGGLPTRRSNSTGGTIGSGYGRTSKKFAQRVFEPVAAPAAIVEASIRGTSPAAGGSTLGNSTVPRVLLMPQWVDASQPGTPTDTNLGGGGGSAANSPNANETQQQQQEQEIPIVLLPMTAIEWLKKVDAFHRFISWRCEVARRTDALPQQQQPTLASAKSPGAVAAEPPVSAAPPGGTNQEDDVHHDLTPIGASMDDVATGHVGGSSGSNSNAVPLISPEPPRPELAFMKAFYDASYSDELAAWIHREFPLPAEPSQATTVDDVKLIVGKRLSLAYSLVHHAQKTHSTHPECRLFLYALAGELPKDTFMGLSRELDAFRRLLSDLDPLGAGLISIAEATASLKTNARHYGAHEVKVLTEVFRRASIKGVPVTYPKEKPNPPGEGSDQNAPQGSATLARGRSRSIAPAGSTLNGSDDSATDLRGSNRRRSTAKQNQLNRVVTASTSALLADLHPPLIDDATVSTATPNPKADALVVIQDLLGGRNTPFTNSVATFFLLSSIHNVRCHQKAVREAKFTSDVLPMQVALNALHAGDPASTADQLKTYLAKAMAMPASALAPRVTIPRAMLVDRVQRVFVSRRCAMNAGILRYDQLQPADVPKLELRAGSRLAIPPISTTPAASPVDGLPQSSHKKARKSAAPSTDSPTSPKSPQARSVAPTGKRKGGGGGASYNSKPVRPGKVLAAKA